MVALTRTDPVPGGGPLTELRIVQPVLLAHGAAGPAWLRVTLNGEGTTIRRGELALGNWGEGFIDRRHPHTSVHELIAGASLGPVTLAAGKGFVPFGTDDPMSRPTLRYPVNHHLAQILERALVLAAVRAGPVLAEAAAFNGDEPERPAQWPNLDRFGDSWATRLTVRPAAPLEVSAAVADVHSPEHRPGAGLDQEKWSVAARWRREGATATYALLEWGRTVEAGGFLDLRTVLVEGAVRRGPARLYARLERTDRPEEARYGSLYRAQRPHLDNTIIGETRWTTGTLGAGRRVPLPWAGLAAEGIVETTFGTIRETTGAIFDPETFYGRSSFWSLTLAVRLSRGLEGHRMGRYGVLPESPHPHGSP